MSSFSKSQIQDINLRFLISYWDWGYVKVFSQKRVCVEHNGALEDKALRKCCGVLVFVVALKVNPPKSIPLGLE